jgi:hypothetical protein
MDAGVLLFVVLDDELEGVGVLLDLGVTGFVL